jgi:hypothetical protein
LQNKLTDILNSVFESNGLKSRDYSIEETNEALLLTPNGCRSVLSLDCKNLERLSNGELADVSGLHYLADSGIEFNDYVEILIYFEPYIVSNEVDLRFRLRNCLIEFGEPSDFYALLVKPFYSVYMKTIRNHGVQSLYHSMRIKGDCDDWQHVAHEALFYLNSSYLKGTEVRAYFNRIAYDEDFEAPQEISPEKLRRKRIRQRMPLKSTVPIEIFNGAMITDYSQRFLQLYRVVECFLDFPIEVELTKMRLDLEVTNQRLLKRIQTLLSNTRALLIEVLSAATTGSERAKLVTYARHKSLMSNESFDDLVNEFYDFRNSHAHARSSEKGDIALPSPFLADRRLQAWNRIAESLAISCIRRLNREE